MSPAESAPLSQTLKPRQPTNPPTMYSAMNTVVKLREGNPVEKLTIARLTAAQTAKLPVDTEITTERGR